MHNNNFNLIRLTAALQVLVVHMCNHLKFEGVLISTIKMFPGVPIFFFVSGFLISAAYERNGKDGSAKFFINRILRIYPALLLCVAFSTIAVLMTGYLQTQVFSLGHFLFWMLGQSSFLQFYNPDFMRGFGVGVLNGALWTITVELQFYILMPILFVMASRYRILFFSLMFISIFVNLFILFYNDWSDLRIKLLSVTFLPWVYIFLFGVFASQYRNQVTLFLDKFRLRWLFLLYVITMFSIGSFSQNSSNSINPISVLLLACCIFKIIKINIHLPKTARTFVSRNDFSYGVYLFHMPMINIIMYTGIFSGFVYGQPIAVFSLTLLAAMFSWFFIEKPALKFKR